MPIRPLTEVEAIQHALDAIDEKSDLLVAEVIRLRALQASLLELQAYEAEMFLVVQADVTVRRHH